MIKQGEYGLVTVEGDTAFCGNVGYYSSDEADDDFPGAILRMGSPFANNNLIFEYSELRHATELERSIYLDNYSQEIKRNVEIIKHLKVT